MSQKELNQRRRSSIQNPQVQNELRNLGHFKIQEILGTTVAAGFRLSGSSRGSSTSSSNKVMCAIPTPNRLGSAARKTTGLAGSTSSGPKGLGAGGKFMPAAIHARFGSTPSIKPPPMINRAPVSKPRIPLPARGQPMGSTGNLTLLNSTRRKSKSYESLLCTPAFTPRSRSKSPGRSMTSSNRRGGGGIVNEAGDQPKTIKITKDKDTQSQMAAYIFDFLETHNCQARPSSMKDFKSPPTLPVAKFKAIIKFVASHMVGPEFFAKGDDDDKIIEVIKLLKYPGPLSKSHLKTATAQHAWPTCLTFLAWLCCRVQSLFSISEDRSRSRAFELSNNDFTQTAFDSYLNLFAQRLNSNNNQLAEETIDNELGNFRERICDLHQAEVNKSVEELEAEKREVDNRLARLQNEPDPAKELKAQLEAETKLFQTINEKIREIENQCKHSYNVNHVQLEKDRIRIDIDAKKQEIDKLTQQVASQKISTEDASKLNQENLNLRNQLDCIRNLINQLVTDKEKRSQFIQNSEKRLYTFITRFSIVEKYNDIVTHLRFDDLIIPANPFSIDELEGWLKNASKTLRKADVKVSDMLKNIDSSSDLKKKQSVEFSDQLEKYRRAFEDLQIKMQSYEQENEYLANEMDEDYDQLLQKVDIEKKDVFDAKLELKKATRILDDSARILENWKEKRNKYTKANEEMEEKIVQDVARYREREAEYCLQIGTLFSNMAAAQQEFYMTNYGIDIYQEIEDEDNEETVIEESSSGDNSDASGEDYLDNTVATT